MILLAAATDDRRLSFAIFLKPLLLSTNRRP
jgi:hypothetical protein